MEHQAIPHVRDLFDLSGKVALVTGSGSGLGQGIAARFSEAGATVVVHYHTSAASAEALVQHITASGGQAVALGADLTHADEVARLLSAVVERHGKLDILINNAGTYPLTGLLEMTADAWEDVLAANLRSVFLCVQAAARQMIAQRSGGAIVNITSIEAENPAPNHSHYNAAKAGVLQFTRAAAAELGAHHIRVNAVAPGLIWRAGIEHNWPEGVARWQRTAPLHRLGQPDDIADACLFLASPAARWITGASLTVDGGVMTHQIY